ncbi:hypothetical protein BKA69DRAFT_1052578 [Paraphysoderma sedebokerense]|nr:hypothetical protein BKA69DRAFT_1052578 [Paraphysoderma sedebokerense]
MSMAVHRNPSLKLSIPQQQPPQLFSNSPPISPKSMQPRDAELLSGFVASVLIHLWHQTPLQLPTNIMSPHSPSSPDSRESQTASIRSFINHILKWTKLPSTQVLLALKYVHTLVSRHRSLPANSHNGSEIRVLLATMILANKYLEDHYISKKSWAKVSGLNVQELNKMELEILRGLSWDIDIKAPEFEEWVEWVVALLGRWKDSIKEATSAATLQSFVSRDVWSTEHSRPMHLETVEVARQNVTRESAPFNPSPYLHSLPAMMVSAASPMFPPAGYAEHTPSPLTRSVNGAPAQTTRPRSKSSSQLLRPNLQQLSQPPNINSLSQSMPIRTRNRSKSNPLLPSLLQHKSKLSMQPYPTPIYSSCPTPGSSAASTPRVYTPTTASFCNDGGLPTPDSTASPTSQIFDFNQPQRNRSDSLASLDESIRTRLNLTANLPHPSSQNFVNYQSKESMQLPPFASLDMMSNQRTTTDQMEV